VQIHNLQKDNVVNNKKMATLPHISQIQEEYFKHLEIETYSQNQIYLTALSLYSKLSVDTILRHYSLSEINNATSTQS
jgi:hypothetical protein